MGTIVDTSKMKIYFCGSIRGGRDDADLYARLIQLLQTYGSVLTEHVGNSALLDSEKTEGTDDKWIHDRDVSWLKEADVVVAEVTQPSLGVGYEIGRAVDMKKPILCLFRPESGKRISAMIEGAKDDKLIFVKHYKESESKKLIQEFMDKFKVTEENGKGDDGHEQDGQGDN